MIARIGMWLAGRVLRLIPESVRGWLLPGEFSFSPTQMPAPPTVPDTLIRLFIAPVNYAGQGWFWAKAVNEHVDNAGAVNMVVRMRSDFGHRADNVVPLGFYAASTRWQRMQRNAVAEGFTHVMIEAEKQPFGAVLDESVECQARWLQKRGVGVVMLCHGTDIRLPSRHIALNHDSLFLDTLAGSARNLERIARRNRRLLDTLKFPVFVSTPDLLLDVPYAQWLPVVVDVDAWQSESIPLQKLRPIVAHAPSSGPVKGSEIIDPVLRKLANEGLIDYAKVESAPHAEMRSIYGGADIVIDQIRIGNYGVAASEAMAAGRVVVGHVSDQVRSHVLDATGRELPVVEATVGNLEEVICTILDNRAHFQSIAAAGPEFVRAVHDGRMSARVLSSALS